MEFTKKERSILYFLVNDHLNLVSNLSMEMGDYIFDVGEPAHKYIDTLEVIEKKLEKSFN